VVGQEETLVDYGQPLFQDWPKSENEEIGGK
jgi:hypothetical protein